MTRRAAVGVWAAAVVLVGGLLTVAPPGQVDADHGCARAPWPSFRELAPSARRVVVGTVAEDLWTGGTHERTHWFRLDVEEVLRGSSPSQLEIESLRSGLPRRIVTDPFCDDYPLLMTKVGKRIAIAFDGRLPGVKRRVTTVAFIDPSRDRNGAEQLTLRQLRRVTGNAVDGSTSRQPRPVAPTVAGRWESVPAAPWGAASPDVAVVDGDMLVMDRYATRRMLRYDPDAREWSRLGTVPDRIEQLGPSVWTGTEFIVFDALLPDRIEAYDPASESWRPLPGSPLAGHDLAAVADTQVAVLHTEQSDGVDLERSVAVLDLATEAWTELPAPAGGHTMVGLFGWDGGLIAVTDDESRSLVQVESLDFADGSWSEPKVVPVRSWHGQPVWAGDRLVWSGDDSVVGRADATYDPATGIVTDEDWDCPLSTRAALWTGRLLVSTNTSSVLDPATGACSQLPGKDQTMGGSAAAAWLGDRIIYWSGGGAEEGQPNPYRRGGAVFTMELAQ